MEDYILYGCVDTMEVFFSIKTLVKDNANIDINKMSYDEPNGIIYF